jgi:hypothetical protein
MKTKTSARARTQPAGSSDMAQFWSMTQAERLQGINDWWAELNSLSKAKKRARMIELGMITAEGKVPVYPMDHVPLGPRE